MEKDLMVICRTSRQVFQASQSSAQVVERGWGPKAKSGCQSLYKKLKQFGPHMMKNKQFEDWTASEHQLFLHQMETCPPLDQPKNFPRDR